jgi:membrane protease YdiL (CAAX protease family)
MQGCDGEHKNTGQNMSAKSNIGIVIFFGLAFGMPWAGWLLIGDAELNLWLFPLFVSLAGFLAAFAEGGKKSLLAFSQRVFAVEPALPYLLAGIVLPVLLGLAYLLNQGVQVFAAPWSPAAVLTLSLSAALITGPIAEEFGWRGYLQHKLLSRMAPFWAALLISGIWWLWHLPLYSASHFASLNPALSFFGYLLTWSLLLVYLVPRSAGSVWPAVALHWAANTHPNVMQSLLPFVDGGLLPGGSKGSLFYLGAACVFAAVNYRFFFVKPARSAV